mgnify:CR=1 FL=1
MAAPLSPIQLREATERDYRAAMTAHGIPFTDDSIRDQAIADLKLVDAATRLGEIGGARPAAVDPEPAKERPDILAKAHEENKTRPVSPLNRPQPLRSRLFHGIPARFGPRWPYAVARIGRICEGATATGEIGGGVDTATVPKLAKAFALLYANFMTRGLPPPPRGQVDHNPFRHQSDADALRILERKVEDICDASTGVLGSWYVK